MWLRYVVLIWVIAATAAVAEETPLETVLAPEPLPRAAAIAAAARETGATGAPSANDGTANTYLDSVQHTSDPARPSAALRLELRGEVMSTAEQVTLAQVLQQCQGLDRLCAETGGISLGDAPAPDRVHVRTRAWLTQWLRDEWPDVKITWSGAPAVYIKTAVWQPPIAAVEEAFRAAVAKMDDADTRWQVKAMRLPVLPKVRIGAYHYVFDNVAATITRGTHHVAILGQLVADDGKAVAPLSVVADLACLRPTVVLKNAVPRGLPIRAEDVTTAWLDGDDLVREAPIGKALRTDHHAGQSLHANDLVIIPAVRRGQTVEVEVSAGDLSIVSPGQALADAGLGESVNVVQATTKKQLVGIAVGDKRVRVTP